MRTVTMRVAAGALLLAPHAVVGQSSGTLAERYDFERPTVSFALPGRLEEVSGLAMTPDGRLFAHDDERAVIYEIDAVGGGVGKRFALGSGPVTGDFEGIVVVGERFFMVTSGGLLYEFREVTDRAEAPYRVTDTNLGAGCEIEGLDYDPVSEALLVPCKVAVSERGFIVIHRVPLDPLRGELAPLVIDRHRLAAHGVDPAFAPSAVAMDRGGTIVVLSGTVTALIEVDRNGTVLSGVPLARDRHRQPEGLAFGPDGALYIADEADGRDARVTAYERVRPGP